MTSVFLFTVIAPCVLAIVLAIALYFVAQKFKVVEDPRIDDVEALLPGANCGGCGSAGCRAFAERCVQAENMDGLFCPVGGNATMKAVAERLGRVAADKAPMLAVLRCAGSCAKRPKTNQYDGTASCTAAAFLYDGDTGCSYGCIGIGDCVAVCSFGALSMDAQTGLPVVDEAKCSACGACVRKCPKGLFELRNQGPKGRRVFVSCRNRDKGAVAKKACEVACIGCSKCAKVCTFDAISIENNVGYIDFEKCKLCRKCVAECPTGSIWETNFPPRKEAAAESTAN